MRVSKLLFVWAVLVLFSAGSLQGATGDNKEAKTMTGSKNRMEKFDFLLGDWQLAYHVPKSALSQAATGQGSGTFKRALDDRYVMFDYRAKLSGDEGSAHGIFGWDAHVKVYRYWWFESSGAFMTATCSFIDNDTLFLNWHNSVLKQTFKKVGPDKIILRMEHPVSEDKYELVLEVTFTRK